MRLHQDLMYKDVVLIPIDPILCKIKGFRYYPDKLLVYFIWILFTENKLKIKFDNCITQWNTETRIRKLAVLEISVRTQKI